MAQMDFNKHAKEFEEALQRLSADVTAGVLFERLPPMELWSRAEADVTRLKALAENCKEQMLVLKPELAVSIEQKFNVFSQGLTNFREILFQNSAEPLTNSRLAFEQLRAAIVDGSEFLLLIREVRDSPSPLIGEVLRLRQALASGGRVVTIEAPESVQPMLERLMKDVESLRSALASLEKAVGEVKERVRTLQDDSIRFAPSGGEAPAKEEPSRQNQNESQQQSQKGQMSLAQFKN